MDIKDLQKQVKKLEEYEKELENPYLSKKVQKSNPLKEWLVNYVGETQQPKDDKVTVEMIIDTISEEFPEFLMVVAEENWIRGYHQGLSDVEEGQKIMRETNKKEKND